MTPRQHYAPYHISSRRSTALVSSPGDHVPLGLALSLPASSAPWLDKFSAPHPSHFQEFLPTSPHGCREPSAVRERREQSGEAGPVLQEEHQEAEGQEPPPGRGLLGGRVFQRGPYQLRQRAQVRQEAPL